MLVQYIIFWKVNPNAPFKKSFLNLKSKDFDNNFLKNIEILDEHEYVIVQLRMNVKKDLKPSEDDIWEKVSITDFKRVMSYANNIVVRRFGNSKEQRKNLRFLGTFQMIITGASKDYWTMPQIDIHKFKIDSESTEHTPRQIDIESDDNLTIFNKMLFGSKNIRGDKIGNLKLPTTLYGLGSQISEEFHQLPQTYLLNIALENHIETKEAREFLNKQFKLTINTVITNFGFLLVYIAKLLDLYRIEYNNINQQSNEIRDKVLLLQIKINNLLTKKSDKKTSSSSTSRQLNMDTEDDLTYRGVEEKLLLKASHHFSLLTEINQVLARANYFRNEATANVEKTSQTLGLTPITLLSEGNKEMPSVSFEFKQFSKSINYYFHNLKIELDHSQSTIRNTVDILKTFLESEQRMVSQRSSEAINWIVIIFAGLGLADALGNFVIFWLEGGSGYQAMFWFIIIVITLIVIIAVLYMWYFRRPKYLKL